MKSVNEQGLFCWGGLCAYSHQSCECENFRSVDEHSKKKIIIQIYLPFGIKDPSIPLQTYIVLLLQQILILQQSTTLMKVNKFEDIISSAINRVKPTLSPSQLQSFDQMLNALPKRIKEFNAQPYLFIFEAMLRRKELVQPALSAFAAMLEENYITVASYDRLASSLSPLMKDHAYAAVQTILRIKEPHLDFLRLYFEVHSTVALPQDLLRKFKTVGYGWLARAFAMTQRQLPQFQAGIYAKFLPQEMPKLTKPQEEEREVRRYVGLVLGQAVQAVQEKLEGGRANRGKHGFCFLCKQPADYYCKDTRVPVCGVDCKKAHLQMLSKSNSLNGHYPTAFLQAIQQLLVSNLQRRQSPALSMDFLVAIYSFSTYQPQSQLPHAKVLILPVIFERIWMLYLSQYGKKGELCQHILASCLTAQQQFVRSMATEYLLRLAADTRFLTVYAAFDRGGKSRLTDFLLRSLDQARRGEFIQALVGNLFNVYTRSNYVQQYNEISLVRAFNHQKDLSPATLTPIFGENAPRKLIKLILRNQLAINREKLGEYLYANEDLLKIFLQEIVQLKQGAPIDQLLRQIFYFINVKISDKIYRLFQILSQVYTPSPPFDEMNFFTYAYFVIMVVTQLNNPAITTKPTMASVLARVQQFSPILARHHSGIVESMFERISTYPFSQNSRGILSHYQIVKNEVEWSDKMRAEEVVVQNNELIYEIVIACVPDVVLLYRLCCLVANHPAICQVFLQLLVDKLIDEPRDGFLVQAISLVVEQQPNAAGCLWRQILQDRPGPGQPCFSLQQMVQATQLLTDGNFKQFVRQLCQYLPITQGGQYYIFLLSLNRKRISLAVPLLIANYDKCQNFYLKLAFIKRLGKFLQSFQDDFLSRFLRKMIEDMPVLPIIEGLLVQCVMGIGFEAIGSQSQACWRAVGKKCLEIRNEKIAQVLEGYLKRGGDQFYESYLIQKTLNCCKKQHISLEILNNLKKLQPYIRQIRPDLLRMFVMEDNLEVIMRFFQCFSQFNATYQLVLDTWNRQPQWIDEEKIESIMNNLHNLLQNGSEQGNLLQLYNIPKIIIKILKIWAKRTLPLLEKYIQIIKFKQMQDNQWFPQQNAMIVAHFNILTQQLHDFIADTIKELKKSDALVEERKEQFDKLVQILHKMHEESRTFQTNIALRCQIRKFLKLARPQATLPSLLDSSIRLIKSTYILQNIQLQHPNEPSLMHIFHAVQGVIQRQSKLGHLPGTSHKKDSIQRLALLQANKDAIRYGEIAIQSAYDYLQINDDLTAKDKAMMKRILISILIQGCFNEQTGSFQSLAGSQLAGKVEHIFHLIK